VLVTTFTAYIPGEPPSWNASYRITRQRVKDRFGQPVLRDDGAPKSFHTLSKTRAVLQYQEAALMILRSAKPSGFKPVGQIIVAYEFDLRRDKDADNLLKALNDALERALGVNDKLFLPVTLRKTISKTPGVTIHVYDAIKWQVVITGKEA
jgi:Holliday junction resolvase RusA-like endonuclease